jgi:hypothetical protein
VSFADLPPIDMGLEKEDSLTRTTIELQLWKDAIHFSPHLDPQFKAWKQKMSIKE